MAVIPEILHKILVCPVDQGELEERSERQELVCRNCGRTYPVRNGIPVMLTEPGDQDSPRQEERRSTDGAKLLRNTRR